MTNLTTFEKNVILIAAGLPQIGDEDDKISGWGAAMGVALGGLTRSGYLRRDFDGREIRYVATEEGIKAATNG